MHSQKKSSNNSNNNNSNYKNALNNANNNNSQFKKQQKITQDQDSFYHYQIKPSNNKQEQKDDTNVDKSSNKRKLDDAWLMEDELELKRKCKEINTLKTALNRATKININLEEALNNSNQKLQNSDSYTQQLIQEIVIMHGKNAQLYNMVQKLQNENYALKNIEGCQVQDSLDIYENYHWNDLVESESFTEVNPEYQKTCTVNNTFFKPQEKCENIESVTENFDYYYS